MWRLELVSKSGRRAEPGKGVVLETGAFDESRHRLPHAGEQCRAALRRGERRRAGYAVPTRMGHQMRKNCAAGAVGIVGGDETIEVNVFRCDQLQEGGFRLIGMPIDCIVSKALRPVPA